MSISAIDARVVSDIRMLDVALDDHALLDDWHTGFEPHWPGGIRHELDNTEYRRCIWPDGEDLPIAYASIAPDNSIDDFGKGEIWLDHLLVKRGARGKGLVNRLYSDRMAYARRFPGRRVLTIPINDQMRGFFRRRHWVERARVVYRGEPYPVLEFLRA
jgi:hypothetical protein